MPKYFIIVNPVSGHRKGISILEKVRSIFNGQGIQTDSQVSEYKNHPFDIAHTIEYDQYEGLCIIGGDGTMHEVINGMLKRSDKRRLPLGLIPAGTGNSLMHDLNCLTPEKAVSQIITNHLKQLDVFEINTPDGLIYGFNILGWGVPVDVNTTAEKMRWLGGQRYNIASLIEVLKNRTHQVKFEIDDKIIEGQYGFFLACNTKYTGNGMKMAPHAIINDGLIDILVARKVPRIKLVALFMKVFSGKHVNDPVINWYRARKFSIITENHHPLNIDGQTVGHSPIHARILEDQIDIFG